LEIDNNLLHGSIPNEIGTLNSVEKLNLGEFITEYGEYKKCNDAIGYLNFWDYDLHIARK